MVRELVAKNLTLNADKTFTLSHQYNTAGNYNVSVVVTDDQHAQEPHSLSSSQWSTTVSTLTEHHTLKRHL